jgi:hypothetical protein
VIIFYNFSFPVVHSSTEKKIHFDSVHKNNMWDMTEHEDSCVPDNLTIFIKTVESVSQTGNAKNNNPKQVHTGGR